MQSDWMVSMSLHGVIDEYHAAPDNSVSEVLQSSVGMRLQPMIIYITTAGFDLTSPCYRMRETCVELLNGKIQDDSLGAFIYELDDDDDIEDAGNWIKCQPNLRIDGYRGLHHFRVTESKEQPQSAC